MPTGKKEKLQEKQLKHKTKFAKKQVSPFSHLKDSYLRFWELYFLDELRGKKVALLLFLNDELDPFCYNLDSFINR